MTDDAPPTGRPSIKTPELLAAICAKVSEGSNLDKLCALPEFPSKDTVYRWLREDPSFSDDYARARTHRADARSDRIDSYVRLSIAGKLDAQVARVAIDAEKWQAGKENPKRYGDKVQAEHSGPDGAAIPVRLESLSDAQLGQLIARIEASVGTGSGEG